SDLERLPSEAATLAHRARDPDVGQEVHLEAIRAVAVAGFAAATRDIEAEPARAVSLGIRLREQREQVANLVENLDVSRRVGARCAPDGRLIDIDHFIELVESLDPIVRAGLGAGTVEVARERIAKDVAYQRTFAGPGDAGHADEQTERKGDIDI